MNSAFHNTRLIVVLSQGILLGISSAGTWNTSPTANSADIVTNDVNSRIGIGIAPSSSSRPAMRLHVAGAGASTDAIRVSQGFLEIDGVNANAASSGGTSNLRIVYFASDRVGFNMQGSEVFSLRTSGRLGVGTNNPYSKFHVAGGGGSADAIRVSNGYLEIDGTNANGAASGGTNNLRIGYFASGRVGFNLQGLEAMSINTSGVLTLTSPGSNGTLTLLGDSEGARIITGKGRSGNRDLRFIDQHYETGVQTELARLESGGRAVFYNRATVEGKTDGQETFVVDQKASVGPVIAQFRRNGSAKVTIKENGDIEAPSGVLSIASVKTNTWTVQPPDYVFEKDYELPTLQKVEEFIGKNKHLPEVPSARQMKAEGLDLAEMNLRLLKKVEELTLYAIKQEKRLSRSEADIEGLRKTLREVQGYRMKSGN
jgi:hypothetical protein